MAKSKSERVKGLIGKAEDYRFCRMTWVNYLQAIAIGTVIGGGITFVFFGDIRIVILVSVLSIIPAVYYWKKHLIAQRKKNLLYQFKDWLASLATSFSAGNNTINSFRNSEKEMKELYGESADIVKEIHILLKGVDNNIPMEDMLLNFAERSGLEDIETFADVFSISNRKSNQFHKVIGRTRDVITKKIDMERRIDGLLQPGRQVLYTMVVMPVVMVLVLNSSGIVSISENTKENVLIKLGALAIFGIAFLWGRYLLNSIKILEKS